MVSLQLVSTPDERPRGHDSRAVANRLIDHADEEDGLVTILQLVKFVYFAHGWTLAVYDRPLIYHPI